MRFNFTDRADGWFDNEPNDAIRQAVYDWLMLLFDTSPDPDDWVGVPIDDGISRVAFVPDTDVVVTYCPWPEGGVVFVDDIETLPRPSS
jgi:hypothetical protein